MQTLLPKSLSHMECEKMGALGLLPWVPHDYLPFWNTISIIIQVSTPELERKLHHDSIPFVHWCDFSDIKSQWVWKLEAT